MSRLPWSLSAGLSCPGLPWLCVIMSPEGRDLGHCASGPHPFARLDSSVVGAPPTVCECHPPEKPGRGSQEEGLHWPHLETTQDQSCNQRDENTLHGPAANPICKGRRESLASLGNTCLDAVESPP